MKGKGGDPQIENRKTLLSRGLLNTGQSQPIPSWGRCYLVSHLQGNDSVLRVYP